MFEMQQGVTLGFNPRQLVDGAAKAKLVCRQGNSVSLVLDMLT